VAWTGWTAPLVRAAGRVGFALVLRRMARDLDLVGATGGDARE